MTSERLSTNLAVSKAAIDSPISAALRPETHGSNRRRMAFAEAVRLFSAGASISRIARLLGTDRKMLRKWLNIGALPSWRQPQRRRMIDAHSAYLEQRWFEGCRNAAL